MKKLFLVLIVVTTLLAGGIWLLQNSYYDQTEIQAPLTLKSTDIVDDRSGDGLETISDQALTHEVDAPVGKKHAKNIAIVPDSNPDSSQAEQELDSEFHKSVKQMLKSSLGGTVEDSINLGRLMNQCGAIPKNEVQIQNNLQTANKKFRPNKKWDFGNGGSISFESFKGYEVHMRDMYDQCLVIRSIFKNDLHKQIARQAAKGNKVARYLYAMWPPSLGGRFRTGKMPDWLEYQNQALAYTWKNIDEGEPLGLLAFGQSFSNSGGGLFTPVNLRYAQVFFLAADKCGLESSWLETEISKYIVDLSVDIGGSKLGRMEIHADELNELFCH